MRLGAALAAVALAALSSAAVAETPPLPERNPVRAAQPAKASGATQAKDDAKSAVELPPGEMPSAPWPDSDVAAAKAACTELLAAVTLDYEPLPAIKEGACGTPAPILVKAFGTDPKVEISPPATMNCTVAQAIARWLKDIVQPGAAELFGMGVVKLRNAASYTCRNRYGSAKAPLSEHALANALDISEFELASGEVITVLSAWPRVVPGVEMPLPLRNPARAGPPPSLPPVSSVRRIGASVLEVTKVKAAERPVPEPSAQAQPLAVRKSEFVRSLHKGACKQFGTVLGPEANEAHKNHFHLDMKARRSGFCE